MNVREYIALENKPNKCEEDNKLINEYNKELIKKLSIY